MSIRLHRGAWVATAITAAALALLATVLVAAKPISDDEIAAQSSAKQALLATMMPFKWDVTRFANGHLVDREFSASLKAAVSSRFDRIMTREEAAAWKRAVNNVVDVQGAGQHSLNLDGGVTNLVFSQTTIESDTARVIGVISVWADHANPDSFEVHRGAGTYDFDVTLIRSGSRWLASRTMWTLHVDPVAP